MSKAPSNEQRARAVANVMKREGLSADSIGNREKGQTAPAGFWSEVVKEIRRMGVEWAPKDPERDLRVVWTKKKDILVPLMEAYLEGTEPPSSDRHDKVDSSQKVYDDNVDKAANDSPDSLAAMEARLMKAIDAKLSSALADMKAGVNVDNVDMDDMPPLPPKIGPSKRKYAGSKSDLRVRVDSELFKLLEEDCSQKFNGNMSTAVDAALWRAYGKPLLSFQLLSKDEGEPDQ